MQLRRWIPKESACHARAAAACRWQDFASAEENTIKQTGTIGQSVGFMVTGPTIALLSTAAQLSPHCQARITQGYLIDGCRLKAVSLCNNSKGFYAVFRVPESCARTRGETRAVLRAGGQMRKAGAAASCVRWSSPSFQSWSVFAWMHPNCCAGLRRAFSHCRPLTAQAHQRDPQVRAGWNEKTARRTGLRSLQSRGIMSLTRRYGPRPARMSPSLDSPRQVRVGCGVQRWRLGEARRRRQQHRKSSAQSRANV